MATNDDAVCLLGYVGTDDGTWRLAMRVTHVDDSGDMSAECVFTACTSKAARAAAGDADGLFTRVAASDFDEARASSEMGMVRCGEAPMPM